MSRSHFRSVFGGSFADRLTGSVARSLAIVDIEAISGQGTEIARYYRRIEYPA
jgi:hypothetical protein